DGRDPPCLRANVGGGSFPRKRAAFRGPAVPCRHRGATRRRRRETTPQSAQAGLFPGCPRNPAPYISRAANKTTAATLLVLLPVQKTYPTFASLAAPQSQGNRTGQAKTIGRSWTNRLVS